MDAELLDPATADGLYPSCPWPAPAVPSSHGDDLPTSPPAKRGQRRTRARAGRLPTLPTLDDMDTRTAAAKRAIAFKSAVIADCGGEDMLSTVVLALIDRLAVLTAWAEAQDYAALSGGSIDPLTYATVASHSRRLAESIGLKRVPKEAEPLHVYLARVNAEEAEKERQAHGE